MKARASKTSVCPECRRTFTPPKNHSQQVRCSKHCQLAASMRSGWGGPYYRAPRPVHAADSSYQENVRFWSLDLADDPK